MIDENLIFVSLITVVAVFIINKQPYLIGILGIIYVFYYLYKERFTNPKDFISFITNKAKEAFETCSSGNLAYCGNKDTTNSNVSFLPNIIRSAGIRSNSNEQILNVDDYQIDKRISNGTKQISINEVIAVVPPLINHKLYLDKLIKFIISIQTDDQIQKDFLCRKIQNNMSKIFYNAYNTINDKKYAINTYNELLYAEREFNDTINIFVFLGMNNNDSKQLDNLQKELNLLNDKLNIFIIETVNNILPNDYNITTSFLPQNGEPIGINKFDTYMNLG